MKKREASYIIGGNVNWCRVEVPLKAKIKKLPYDSVIPLMGIYSEKMESLIRKDTCIPMFIATLFTTAKTLKQPKFPSTDEWIKTLWCTYLYLYTQWNITQTLKIMPVEATWMQVEIIILREIRQRKTNVIYHLHVKSETYDTNQLIYKTEKD